MPETVSKTLNIYAWISILLYTRNDKYRGIFMDLLTTEPIPKLPMPFKELLMREHQNKMKQLLPLSSTTSWTAPNN